MSKIEKFEDLRCWQASRVMVREVYEASENGKLARDFDTKSQIKRAALSAMNNIAEGFGRYSNKDFVRCLNTAQNSVQEVQSILFVLADLNYVEKDRIQRIRTLTEESRNLILGFIRYLTTKKQFRVSNLNTWTHEHLNTLK